MVYVTYRSQHPDKETREKVLKKLKEDNIDVNQLVEFKTDDCKQAEPTTEWGSPPKGIGEMIGELLYVILNILKTRIYSL